MVDNLIMFNNFLAYYCCCSTSSITRGSCIARHKIPPNYTESLWNKKSQRKVWGSLFTLCLACSKPSKWVKNSLFYLSKLCKFIKCGGKVQWSRGRILHWDIETWSTTWRKKKTYEQSKVSYLVNVRYADDVSHVQIQ